MSPVNRIKGYFPEYNMPRPPKPPRVAVGTDLPPALWECIRDFCDASGMAINVFFEEAARSKLKVNQWETDESQDRKRGPK